MEALLHYVWKHRLFNQIQLRSEDGAELEILDPGIHNTNAGPDFFNAKIRMEGTVWVGNVEIHSSSSDWYRHNHDRDKAYNSVILHVVASTDGKETRAEIGRIIPQLVIAIPPHVQTDYQYLLQHSSDISCLGRIAEIPSIFLSDWMDALLSERMERKTNHLLQLLKDHKGDWNEVFYIILSRSFGFGINSDAFERIAKSLSLNIIRKHGDSELQVEALFFGQAGLLDDEPRLADKHFCDLRREYKFLSKKYGLQALDAHLLKRLRIRPSNFPAAKLTQLASIVRKQEHLFSRILEIADVQELRSLFKERRLGFSSVSILLINAVVPMLFAYGKHKQLPQYMERSIELLESLPPENNHIIANFLRAGIEIRNAGDTQALIQLKREYCEQKKCIFCRIGHKLLSKQQIYD